MCLQFNRMIAWLGVTVHHQMAYLMSQVEALSVVVCLERIHNYYRAQFCLK